MHKISLLKRALVSAFMFVCMFAASSASAQAQPGDQLTDTEVSDAIDKIKAFLYESQDASGAWLGKYHIDPQADHKNVWGPTAMALLALISAGESPQHPDIERGLKLLAEVEFKGVYALSMRAHVWSYLPQGVYGQLLLKDADTMIRSSFGKSRFVYPVAKDGQSQGEISGRIDNSTTQYGMLALWQASKRGINIPPGFWMDGIDNFLEQQAEDGGWSYSGNRNTTQSMTLAGLTCMYVAQQELFRDLSTPNLQVAASIQKAMAYLDKNFSIDSNVHGGVSYKWYGYERVGLANGRKFIGGTDWFQAIAKRIVDKNARYGTSFHTAAFDLMFLARGRVPVWINKLEIPGMAWDNRPNDVYYLNQYISGYREHEVNWQSVNVETSNPEDWIGAPLMWISGREDLVLSDEHLAKLKQYIDLGGTILFNAEEGSSGFRASVENLAEKLYPDLKFEAMPSDHPMANLLEGDPRGRSKPDARILSNGARVLMIMPKDDWGMTFQADREPDANKTDAWKYITNIYGVVTDRGALTPRLDTPLVLPKQRDTVGTIKVALAQWQDPAGKLPEAGIYRIMRTHMHNETGMKLDVQQVPLSELSAVDPALLHLVGVNAIEVSDDEVNAIGQFIQNGGTVLIENLGGKGEFVDTLKTRLAGVVPGQDSGVNVRSDIIRGRNLPDGSTNNGRLVFRRMVLENANPDARLLLRGYESEDRYPVLISYEDLSLGMLGVKQYGINGYGIDTARGLMINILLEAHQAKTASP